MRYNNTTANVSEFNFTWKSSAGATVLQGDGENAISNQVAGTYTVSIKHIATSCVAAIATEITIEENSTDPTIEITQLAADADCGTGNGTGSLSATADGNNDTNVNYTFEWFIGTAPVVANTGFSTSSAVTSLSAGTYNLLVTNTATGCDITTSYTVSSEPLDIDITSASVVSMTACAPANGSISVTGITPGNIADYTFKFYKETYPGGILAETSNTLTGQAAGIYYVEVSHTATSCISKVYEYEILDESIAPVLAQVDISLQSNCNTNSNGTMTVTADGSVDLTAYSFTWYAGATATGTPISATSVATGMAAGQYTLVVSNLSTGCTSTETFNMADEENTDIDLVTSSSSNTVCGDVNGDGTADYNGRVSISVLNPSIGVLDYTYYLAAGTLNFANDVINAPDAKQASNVVDGLVNGDYTAYVVNEAGGCESNLSYVTVNDATNAGELDFIITQDFALTNCDPLRPNGEATITPLSDDPTRYTFYWYEAATSLGNKQMALDSTLTLVDMRADTYFVEMIDRYSGCTIDGSITIQDATLNVPFPDVSKLNDRKDCIFPDGAATADIDGEIANYSFIWRNAGGEVISESNTVGSIDVGTYTVQAMNLTTGCMSDPADLTILDQTLTPIFTVNSTESKCSNNDGQADMVFEDANIDLDSVAWSSDGVLISNDFRLGEVGPGFYDVYAIDKNNCEYQLPEPFEIETDIVIYNGVSDNGDGKNDIFLIDCANHFGNNSVKIYNRTGTVVYEAKSYDNGDVVFSGRSNTGIGGGNNSLPPGTYFYIFDKGTGEEVLQGYLELVR
jgi:hypothetical protein